MADFDVKIYRDSILKKMQENNVLRDDVARLELDQAIKDRILSSLQSLDFELTRKYNRSFSYGTNSSGSTF